MRYRINKMPSKNDTRYYIACSIRNKNKVSTKNIKPLGKHSDLCKLYPDVNAYLKDELEKFNCDSEDNITLKFDPDKSIKPSEGGLVYGGSLFIKRVLDSMNMNQLLDDCAQKYKFTYSLKDLVYFLITSRILTPDSKYGMFKNYSKKQLFEVPFSKDSIYRAMDILLDNKDLILKHCFDNEPINIKRNKRILYYDCTNTYFESEFEDDLRARGHGKRNEVEPLVSLGLMIDASGIPLTYTVFKGSTNEQNTLIPLEKEITDNFRQAKFIMITDAGLSSKNNRAFNSLANRKFITTLPVRKMSKEKLNAYIFDKNKGWTSENKNYDTPEKILNRYDELSKEISDDCLSGLNCENKLKELDALCDLIIYRRYNVLIDKTPKAYLNGNKSNEFIDEDYLISFSLKYLLRQRRQRDKVIKKAKSMLNNKGKLKAKNSTDPKFYISEVKTNQETGEETTTYREINNDLILEQEKLDGFYCVTTNLVEDDNEVIIDAMRYRWFIEDSFKIMKQEFHFRPVNHSKQDRIKCHFFTCFLSLLVYRYIQTYCRSSNSIDLKNLTDERLLESLRNYNFTKLKKDFLIPSFEYNKTIKDLEDLFNVSLSKEIVTPARVSKELKKQILKN